jgi:hypothetical protein
MGHNGGPELCAPSFDSVVADLLATGAILAAKEWYDLAMVDKRLGHGHRVVMVEIVGAICASNSKQFPTQDYLIEKTGYTLMYNRLKERCIARLLRDHKDGRRPVVLVTGVRRKESRRRMGHIVSEQREGRRVWCAPLCDWDDRDKEAYAARHSLPVNEVAKRLCMSGECLCGAFARPEELAEIRAVCPETHDYIRRLELAVRDAGQTRCRWGEKPPPSRRTGRADRPDQPWLPLCEDCVRKRD